MVSILHKIFLKLLEKAEGVSKNIIAINLDIRGFSSFCLSVDSINVVTYLTKIYTKIINENFDNAEFYKSTGDGLIIILPCSKDNPNLKKDVNSTLNICLNLLDNFSSICKEERIINFPTPDKIGIGITRGSACQIISNSTIIDYSGRTLNLASRLMDMARPCGIVFDESFNSYLLEDSLKEQFSEDEVYIRGIAEKSPVKIHFSKNYTVIPENYHQPIVEPSWTTIEEQWTLGTLKKMPPAFEIDLTQIPLDKKKIVVDYIHQTKLEGIYQHHYRTIDDEEIDYAVRGDIHCLLLSWKPVIQTLLDCGVTDDMMINFVIKYPYI